MTAACIRLSQQQFSASSKISDSASQGGNRRGTRSMTSYFFAAAARQRSSGNVFGLSHAAAPSSAGSRHP